MKKYTIGFLIAFLFFITNASDVSAQVSNAQLNLTASPNPTIGGGEELLIRFTDVGADYYQLTASCKDGVIVNGKARPNLCEESEKIYPTGKDTILVRHFYPAARDTTFHLEVAAIYRGAVVRTDSVPVTVKPIANTSVYTDLQMSVTPNKLTSGDEAVIRFNDIGADYYVLSALCKDGVFAGKAWSDICVEGERIYPTGKDTIAVRDFYPRTSVETPIVVKVAAFARGQVIKNDSVTVSLRPSGTTVNSGAQGNTNTTVRVLSNQEKLDLVADIFGKESDLYRVVQMLIILGII